MVLDSLIHYFQDLSVFGKIAVILNVFLLLLAGFLFKKIVPSDSDSLNHKRSNWLRVMNLLLLAVYAFDWLLNYYFFKRGHSEIFIKISQTGLIFLLTYLFVQFSHVWTIRKYGKEREIDGETIKVRTYQSEMGHILIMLLAVIATLLLLINVWEVTAWLQATGVIGGLLVILFGTKDAWASDVASGLILLHHGKIAPGVVCRVDSMNILAVVRKMTLTETVFHDVVQRHNIIVPNSKLRATAVEVLNTVEAPHCYDFVTFKIGYDTPSEQVEKFIEAVWQRACEQEKQLDIEKKPRLVLYNPGDHAIEWRVNYRLESVYRIKQSRFALHRAAFDLQQQHQLSLATPLTWSNVSPNHPDPSQPTLI